MPDKIAIPVPVFVKLLVPLITPLKVAWVPPTLKFEFPCKDISPAKVLVPVDTATVPKLLNVSVVE